MQQVPRETRIKFCGMQRAQDVQTAIELGVDYVGFVLAADANRAVQADQVLRIQEEVDCSRVCRVGVFRNQRIDEINLLVERLGLDLVQLHGHEDVAVTANIAAPVIRMVAVPTRATRHQPAGSFAAGIDAGNLYAFLLDACGADGASGGLGVVADPETLSQTVATMPAGKRLFLAGGLTSQNVAAIVRQYRPDAVDVSSGIESQPGIKDAERMRAFVDAVRSGHPA